MGCFDHVLFSASHGNSSKQKTKNYDKLKTGGLNEDVRNVGRCADVTKRRGYASQELHSLESYISHKKPQRTT